MVVNEALAAGIPVLGSRYSGAAEELIRDDELGRLIDPLDPDSLDAALMTAVRDGQWAKTSPTRLRAALKGYTSKDAADAILQAVQAAVTRRPQRSDS
jgi:glycosyltransferase involved in cell wall biosynthesis